MSIECIFQANCGDTVTLERCSGSMGSGSFASNGFVHLDGLRPDDYNVDLVLDELDVDSPVFKGPVTAKVNVQKDVLTQYLSYGPAYFNLLQERMDIWADEQVKNG